MLLLSSLHLHPVQPPTGGDDCADCVEHHCAGHISQQAQTLHDCLLCQFLSLPKMVAAVAEAVTTDCSCKISYAQCQPAFYALAVGTIVTRGPPAV